MPRSMPAINARDQCPRSMVVARYALGLGDLLVFDGWLQHHAVAQLVDQPALDLLPRRLMGGKSVAAMPAEGGATRIQLLLGDQDVGAAPVEIDAHRVTRLEHSE